MTTAGVALLAALGGISLLALLVLPARRSHRRRDDDIVRTLVLMGDRMDELATRLGIAVDQMRAEGTRDRALLELPPVLDLEEVLARTVEAASAVRGVDAALVRVEASDGHASIASISIPPAFAETQLVSGPPDGRRITAVRLAYLYGGDDEPPGALRSGIAVPVEHGGRQLGFLAAYSFDADIDDRALVRSLDAIARSAGPAIESTIDLAASQRLGPEALDTLTGLGNRTGFHAVLARELARAHRNRGPLAVLLVDLDGFRSLNDEIGQLGGDDFLRRIATRLRGCMRDTDVACRIGGDEFAIVLPASGRAEAEGLFARVQATLLRQPPESAPSITLSGGIAEAAADDDALALFHRAERALSRAKGAGRGTAA